MSSQKDKTTRGTLIAGERRFEFERSSSLYRTAPAIHSSSLIVCVCVCVFLAQNMSLSIGFEGSTAWVGSKGGFWGV